MLKIKIFIITVLLISSVFSEVLFEPNARIDDRIDRILQTLSSRSGVALPSGIFQQPMNYEEIRRFLNAVEKSDNLTQTDREFLAILQRRYSGEDGFFGITDDDGRRRILANLDLTGSFRADFKDSARLDAYGMINPRVRANLGIISFYTDMYLWTQYRSDTAWHKHDYQPFRGQTFNVIGDEPSNMRAMDDFRGGISAQFPFARVDIAVDNLTSGPAAHNRLILNAVDKPVFYTRFMLDFNRVQYYQIFGVLRQLKHLNKFLYYHRAQIPFFENRFTLGLSASIISGSIADSALMALPHGQTVWALAQERKIEPVYMIPFLPYVFAEHYTGDRDNKQIALDFELRLPQIARWYAEFMIDDANDPIRLFTSDHWGNKWAITVGTQWFPEIAGRNAVFGFEYCRVEPWVYTHFWGVATNYEHFGKGIGAELGPNSEQIRGLAEIFITYRQGIKFEAVRNRFNRNVRGGSIGDVFIYDWIHDIFPDYSGLIDSERKTFLGKGYTTEYEFSLSHLFRQFQQRYEMETRLFYSSQKGFGLGFWGGFRF